VNAVAPVRPTAALPGWAGRREGHAPVRERLITMLLLVALAHAIVILGLTFGAAGAGHEAPGLEVLLVTEDLPPADRNDQAAYLAQRTQLGSGNTHELPTGSPQTKLAALQARDTGTDAEDTEGSAGAQTTLASSASGPLISYMGSVGNGLADRYRSAAGRQWAQTGRGDADELVLRGDIRTGQWLSPDTRESDLAPYMDAWRRKIERLGSLNYPSEAREAGLSGSPVIEVAIDSAGRLLEASVQRSSGWTELDQAALGILKLASPFNPFPRQLADRYRVLRFSYQWEFVAGQPGGAGSVISGAYGASGP
jgi:periplasmic protein TonB